MLTCYPITQSNTLSDPPHPPPTPLGWWFTCPLDNINKFFIVLKKIWNIVCGFVLLGTEKLTRRALGKTRVWHDGGVYKGELATQSSQPGTAPETRHREHCWSDKRPTWTLFCCCWQLSHGQVRTNSLKLLWIMGFFFQMICYLRLKLLCIWLL